MIAPGLPNASQSNVARGRRFKQRVALAVVLTLIVMAALFTPEIIAGRSGDARLSTYFTGPQGARLLFELTQRLGWRSERWTEAATPPMDPSTVIAVLDPAQPLGAIESHELLDRVRKGSAMLYVLSGDSPLNDSLHLRREINGGFYEPTRAGTADAPAATIPADTLRARRFSASASDTVSDDDDADSSRECAGAGSNGALPMWVDEKVQLWNLRFVRPAPNDTVIFARTLPSRGRRDRSAGGHVAAAGFPLGRGRVVVFSDPDFLRNDVLRVCKWGLDVVAVRALDYLAVGPAPRNHLVYDEYHQGFGTHPGTLRAICAYLFRSSSGHVLLQGMLAGLVLLLASGPRLLPAHDPLRVERRSPLEHVGALAQAYEGVGGTRTATARLLRGVRRRVQPGAPNEANRVDDQIFLDRVATIPELTASATLVRRALSESVTAREFMTVGASLARIENTLLKTRR